MNYKRLYRTWEGYLPNVAEPDPEYNPEIIRGKLQIGCRTFETFEHAFRYLAGKATNAELLDKYGWSKDIEFENGDIRRESIGDVRARYLATHNLDIPCTHPDAKRVDNRGDEIGALYILQKGLLEDKHITKKQAFTAPWLIAYMRKYYPAFV